MIGHGGIRSGSGIGFGIWWRAGAVRNGNAQQGGRGGGGSVGHSGHSSLFPHFFFLDKTFVFLDKENVHSIGV